MYRCKYRWIGIGMYIWMGGCIWMGRWMDGCMDGWVVE